MPGPSFFSSQCQPEYFFVFVFYFHHYIFLFEARLARSLSTAMVPPPTLTTNVQAGYFSIQACLDYLCTR